MGTNFVDAVSIGEIMVESIFNIDSDPLINSTIVVKSRREEPELGGAAVNVAWYLGSLGKSVRLIAPISSHHANILSEELNPTHIDLTKLIRTHGETDHLLTVLSPQGHRSIYTLGTIPHNLETILLNQSKSGRVIIMNGGRHQEVRQAFRSLSEKHSEKLIAFNPSYAVYEYRQDELTEIMKRCDVCFLNEDEYRFVKAGPAGEVVENMPRLAFVVTRANKGATMFSSHRQYNVKSLLNHNGIFLGAGDACLAGFLTGLLDEVSLEQALQRGMRLAALVVERGKIRTEIAEADVSSITS
jgi:sugar/nucleoside kinase (ribokinase family)